MSSLDFEKEDFFLALRRKTIENPIKFDLLRGKKLVSSLNFRGHGPPEMRLCYGKKLFR